MGKALRQLDRTRISRLRRGRQVLRELERLYRRRSTPAGADPLRELEQLNVVRYESDAAPPATDTPRGPRRLLAASEPFPGRWVALDGTAYPGGPGYCPALARWGEATRAVLAPALRAGYLEEDRLCAQLGLDTRSNRLALVDLHWTVDDASLGHLEARCAGSRR